MIAQDNTLYSISLNNIRYLSQQQERYKLNVETKEVFIKAYIECDSMLNIAMGTLSQYKSLYHIQEGLLTIKDSYNQNISIANKALQAELDKSKKLTIFASTTSVIIATLAIVLCLNK